jgi:hypothetical protein
MDRLTYRDENGKATRAPMSHAFQVLEKLARYEDAEEQGRLIVLPCKVGDTVWMFSQAKAAVEGWRVYHIGAVTVNHGFLREIRSDDFSKTVFLTREEAEAALGGDHEGRSD